jgi:hypothetical protein
MKKWLFFEPQSMICNLRSAIFSAAKIFLEDSGLRGRIALPGGPPTPFFLSASSAIYDPSPLLSWFLGMIFTILPSFIT